MYQCQQWWQKEGTEIDLCHAEDACKSFKFKICANVDTIERSVRIIMAIIQRRFRGIVRARRWTIFVSNFKHYLPALHDHSDHPSTRSSISIWTPVTPSFYVRCVSCVRAAVRACLARERNGKWNCRAFPNTRAILAARHCLQQHQSAQNDWLPRTSAGR